MIILVLGSLGTGKSFFIKNLLPEIPGYNINTEHKLFIHPSRSELRDPDVQKLFFTYRYLVKETGIEHIIIEANSDVFVPPEIKANADFVVFTSGSVFKRYFNREFEQPAMVNVSDTLKANDCVRSSSGLVIWDRRKREFKCLMTEHFKDRSIEDD